MNNSISRNFRSGQNFQPKRLPRSIRLQLMLTATACLAAGTVQPALAFDPAIPLSSLNGNNGFRLDGVSLNDQTGKSVSSVGDVNGDGIDDLIIGANSASPNSNSFAGSSYVVFGKSTAFAATTGLSALNGSNGFRLDGVTTSDQSGWSVSSAGDINGDGIDDMIIGAPFADPNGIGLAGSSYVVFGKSTAFASTINLSTLNGINGFRLDGVTTVDVSSRSVTAAGDVNGDGIDDLLVGAYGADPGGLSNAGSSYVVFGKLAAFTATINLSTLNGNNGFRLDGVSSGHNSGRSVSSAGDINGDGIDDLIIGVEYAAFGGSESGSSYVVFGKTTAFAATISLSTLNGTNGFRLDGVTSDHTGFSVSSAGDVNGDGIDDLIIGAYQADPGGLGNAGSSFVLFGKTTAFAASASLSTLDGSNGFRLNGATSFDLSGASVSGAGDINGDGIDDLIIGAAFADPGGLSVAGSSFVVFGKSTAFAATASLAALNGSNGFRLDGAAAEDRSGSSVSAAGDINGDGMDDLIIGAYFADPGGQSYSGSSYVVFGTPCGHRSEVTAGTWKMVGIPCDLNTNDTVATLFSPNFEAADYLQQWVVWERDAALNIYRQLALTDTLLEGDGLWLFSNIGSDLSLASTDKTPTVANNVNAAECVYVAGCFEILLEPPVSGGTSRFNLIGHPHGKTIDWATVRFVIDGGLPLTPQEAQDANLVSKTYFIYNGNSYDSLDDVTPGMGGTLSALDGIWVEVLDGTLGAATVKMLIPFGATLGTPPPPPP